MGRHPYHIAIDSVTYAQDNNLYDHCGVPGCDKLIDIDDNTNEHFLVEIIVAADAVAVAFVHIRNVHVLN